MSRPPVLPAMFAALLLLVAAAFVYNSNNTGHTGGIDTEQPMVQQHRDQQVEVLPGVSVGKVGQLMQQPQGAVTLPPIRSSPTHSDHDLAPVAPRPNDAKAAADPPAISAWTQLEPQWHDTPLGEAYPQRLIPSAWAAIEGPLLAGTVIRIEADGIDKGGDSYPEGPPSFFVNLLDKEPARQSYDRTASIMLHVNPRVGTSRMVINSYHANCPRSDCWGKAKDVQLEQKWDHPFTLELELQPLEAAEQWRIQIDGIEQPKLSWPQTDANHGDTAIPSVYASEIVIVQLAFLRNPKLYTYIYRPE